MFEDGDITINEGQPAQLTVVLDGGAPQCEGTVHYKTTNGSARAPGDYVAAEGELTFRAGDDRKESLVITTVNDTAFEQQENFNVVLSQGAAPGGITAWGPPAVVRLNSNDPSPQPSPSPTPTPTRTSPGPSPTATATATNTGTGSPSPSPSETATESPTPTESASPTPSPTESQETALPPEEPPRGKGGMIAAIAVGVILLAGGGGLWLLRRRYGFR